MTRFWDGRTDRRRDRQTDGQTDGVTALLDLLSPSATQVKIQTILVQSIQQRLLNADDYLCKQTDWLINRWTVEQTDQYKM